MSTGHEVRLRLPRFEVKFDRHVTYAAIGTIAYTLGMWLLVGFRHWAMTLGVFAVGLLGSLLLDRVAPGLLAPRGTPTHVLLSAKEMVVLAGAVVVHRIPMGSVRAIRAEHWHLVVETSAYTDEIEVDAPLEQLVEFAGRLCDYYKIPSPSLHQGRVQ